MKKRVLIAADFDGTIAPICERPEQVVIDPDAAELFRSLAGSPGIEVAFLSGRDLDDLTLRTSGIRAYRSGSHGRQLAAPDGTILRSLESSPPEMPADLRDLLVRRGLRVETKRYGAALHWRGIADVHRDDPDVGRFASWASSSGLALVEGRAVLEAAMPGGDKSTSLQELMRLTRCDSVLYAGDDLTDLPAIAWAARHGCGVFMKSGERPELPDPPVMTVETQGELLETIRRFLSTVDQAPKSD